MMSLIKSLIFTPLIARPLLRVFLRLHNLCYILVSSLARHLEADKLHPKHRLMNYHQWFIDQVQPSWRVLDIGCGNGALSLDLSKKTKTIIGIDLNAVNISEAKKRARHIEFICGDATTYPFDQKFDALILSNVLEHIENRKEFLTKLAKISGRLLIRVPLIDRDWITLYKQESGIDYRLDPTHFIEYTTNTFAHEVGESGLKIESTHVQFGELYAVVKG